MLLEMIPQSGNVKDAGGQQPAGEQRQDHRCELWLALVRSTNRGTGGKMDCMGTDAGELPDMLGAHEYFLDELVRWVTSLKVLEGFVA